MGDRRDRGYRKRRKHKKIIFRRGSHAMIDRSDRLSKKRLKREIEESEEWE